MHRLQLILYPLVTCGCLAGIVGCGSAGQEGARHSVQAADPAPTGTDNESLAAGSGVDGDPIGASSPSDAVQVAPPTADQIALWTPAPFEPVELLAIREWEKTSFTGRLAATADGEHFIVAGSRVVLWSLAGTEPEHVFLELTAADQDRDILSLAVAPDGRWFAVGDSTGTVRIWTIDDRQEVVTRQLDSTGIQCLAISPDAEEIATNSYDNKVSLWTAAGLQPRQTFEVNSNGLNRIEYLAPELLAAAGETTSLWNTKTGELVQELSPGRYSFALTRSPDGASFIYGSDDALHIWNVAESQVTADITHGVSGSELVTFSPDGKYLAMTNGRSVQLWDLAQRTAVHVIDSFGWPVVGISYLPKSNLLAVASDSGCTRIWGTRGQGAAHGLQPVHAALAMPAADSHAPATPAQLEQVIDLRTFPRLPGSEPSLESAGNFSCVSPVTVDEARTFYKHFLGQAGWSASIEPANPTAMEFRKDGFMISAAFYEAGPGLTNIMLHHAGNYDVRWMPKFDAAPIEPSYESEYTVSYRTRADLVDIETNLLRRLHAAGWTGYTRLKSSHGERADERDLNFVQNGTTLRVSIGRFPVDPASYTVQYSLFPNNCWTPIPADCGYVEFDGSTEPALVATTAMTLEQTRAFYDRELQSHGWIVREHGRSLKDDHCWLPYLRQQSNMTVGLTMLPDGRTLIRIGDTGGSLWELSQTQAEPAPETAAAGLEAADFPVLNASKAATYDKLDESIEVVLDATTLAEATKLYTEALAKLGWTPEEGGIRAEDYTLLTFQQGNEELTLRARATNGNAVVSFRGDGLRWSKELPGGKQIVSYETWLWMHQQPAGLELLDRFAAEMRAINAPPAADR